LRDKEMRMLAFLLSGSECGRFVGAERRFFELSARLKNLGLQIFALEYETLHPEKCGQHGYSPIVITRRFCRNAIFNSLRLAFHGLVSCVRHRCDIVYVTAIDPWMESYWVALIAPYIVSRLCRKPLAIIFHHLVPEDFRDRSFFKLEAIRNAVCMAVSETTANDVKRCFGVREVTVVGNGVNAEMFDIPSYKEEEYDAVFHGRIAEDKGIFELLRAWRKVAEKVSSAQLLLIGGTDKAIEEELKETLIELQLERNVNICGFVSDERLAQLLKSSKIFVLPSHAEGFGLSVVEAMAAGLPCILSDLPALREYYSSTAIFVQRRNVESLANAILFLLSDPEKRAELRDKGKRLVSRFSWKEVALKEYSVLRSAVRCQEG
jgi:glycosyltransferase involved in cell wall biosynthesis